MCQNIGFNNKKRELANNNKWGRKVIISILSRGTAAEGTEANLVQILVENDMIALKHNVTDYDARVLDVQSLNTHAILFLKKFRTQQK